MFSGDILVDGLIYGVGAFWSVGGYFLKGYLKKKNIFLKDEIIDDAIKFAYDRFKENITVNKLEVAKQFVKEKTKTKLEDVHIEAKIKERVSYLRVKNIRL